MFAVINMDTDCIFGLHTLFILNLIRTVFPLMSISYFQVLFIICSYVILSQFLIIMELTKTIKNFKNDSKKLNELLKTNDLQGIRELSKNTKAKYEQLI